MDIWKRHKEGCVLWSMHTLSHLLLSNAHPCRLEMFLLLWTFLNASECIYWSQYCTRVDVASFCHSVLQKTSTLNDNVVIWRLYPDLDFPLILAILITTDFEYQPNIMANTSCHCTGVGETVYFNMDSHYKTSIILKLHALVHSFVCRCIQDWNWSEGWEQVLPLHMRNVMSVKILQLLNN